MEKNTYFEQMRTVGEAFEEERAIRRKERKALISQEDWDGVKAWNKREERDYPNPFTSGEAKAFHAYQRNLQRGTDYFEIDDLPWNYEREDFVKTLRKAGITDIVVTDESTALMEGLSGLDFLGCHMQDFRTVTRENAHPFGSKEPEIKTGIHFTI